MNDAAERFGHCRFGSKRRLNAHAVDRWHGDEFSKPARQPRDAVLAVELALMRIACVAVLTRRRPRGAHAVQALIDDDAVAGAQVRDFRTDFDDFAADLVAEDL